jgi:NAD(P)-dependent dehydrogenase (short-subunit alcohol dehydrogenase family)
MMADTSMIGSRRVSLEMNGWFAALSGDRNPMHLDPLAARRTQAGAPVVHGVHTLLWALEQLVGSGIVRSPIVHIRVKFLKWLYIGDQSTLVIPRGEQSDPGVIQVRSGGLRILAAEVFYGIWFPNDPNDAISATFAASATRRTTAVDRRPDDLIRCEGIACTAAPADAGEMFPRLAAYLSGATVAEIAACSYIVGMEVPGLHSMFSALDLKMTKHVDPSVSPGLSYRLSSYDERFQKARIEVAGCGIRGTLEAFSRQPPAEQASMPTVGAVVHPGEFSRMRALVIGGSRGLGEITAKLIAAGGGVPIISYAVGKTDAERVAGEIRDWGGVVDVLHYDVCKTPAPQLAGLHSGVTHLFYFATNAIFKPKESLVSRQILLDFVAYYLLGFHDLCVQLLSSGEAYCLKDQRLHAFYPSSIAVEQRPAGMTEYSMVKAAGEQMCRDLNQFLPGIHVLTSRLPRVRTDQTASVTPTRETDAMQVLLPIIRQMNQPCPEPRLERH